ncbi:hypothetical protein HA38_00900 [Pantoea allii]|nr:hypothetical protein HA38_00900 [Pantoea allii]
MIMWFKLYMRRRSDIFPLVLFLSQEYKKQYYELLNSLPEGFAIEHVSIVRPTMSEQHTFTHRD